MHFLTRLRPAVKALQCFLALVFVLSTVIMFTAATYVEATEMGGGAYANGAVDFLAGAVPPPGLYFMDYLAHYSADKLTMAGQATPDFDLKATANVFRFLYVTKKEILGGLWAMHVIVPFVSLDVTAGSASQSSTGMGDISIDPFALSWHSKNWHAVAGVEFFMPTGGYNKTDLANIGRNYWTIEPIAAVTYVSDSGLDLSAKFMYDFNTKNSATDYLSGQEFHLDYSIGRKFNDFTFGLGGYYYKQVTSDKVNGTTVADGLKGQVFGIGPQIKYDYKNMNFVLKYQTETSVKNKPEGNKYWFTFLYIF